MIKPYFSHDYYSRTNPKLIKLQIKLGHAGKGIFWDLIEILHEENGFIKISDIELISYQIRADIEIIKSIFFDFDLFENDSQKIWSNSVLKRIEKQKQKSEILSKNGKKGGRPKANEKQMLSGVKANEKQMLSGVKANEKQKESKEEKEVNELNEQIKENINKNKSSSEEKNDDDFNSDKLIQKFNLLAETFSSAYKGVNQFYSKSSDTLKVLLSDNKFDENLFFQKLTLSAEQISNWSNAPIDMNWCFKNTDNYYKIINGEYIKKIAVQIEDDPWADCEIVNPPKNWKGKK